MAISKDALKAIEELTKALEAGGYNVFSPPGNWHWGVEEKPEKKDDEKYPHKCPKCGGPAYIGFSDVDCKNKCK